MKERIFRALFCVAVLATATFAQNTDDDVVKITSKLVQLDVVVTDSRGNQVSDLKSSDFTVLQDGKAQTISGFSYVSIGTPTEKTEEARDKKQAGIPPVGPKPGARGRIITFVVDDGNCRASMIGMKASREALEKFITNQMLPEDVASIYQTRSGSSMFQQYTSDKAQLLRAARKIRWYPASGNCAPGDGTFYDAARVNTDSIITNAGIKSISAESEDDRKRRELNEDRSRDNQVIGALGVLQYAIRGLAQIPGRKVLFVLSDGMPIRARDGRTLNTLDPLRDLTELANRSAVVLNAIDIRGLFDASMIEARDEVSTLGDVNASNAVVQRRQLDVRSSEDGLAFLAEETGGKFYKNENELDSPIRRGLAIEKGYYLVAYEPDEGTFRGKYFNKIEIKLNRPDLRISSRSGFLGVVDQTSTRKAKTGDSELYEAIVAPLPTAGMNLRLSANFGNSAAEGNFVRAQIHIPGNDVSFVDSNGLKKAVFDVVAVTLNEKNEVIDEFTRTHNFSVEAAALPLIEKNGLVYSADVKVMKPGFYNFRVAMRDATSRRLGTVSQSVEIPELKSRHLYVSGFAVSGVDVDGKFDVPAAVKPEVAFALPVGPSAAAIRQFQRGSVIAYSYMMYNATLKGGRPNLTVQVNLYQEGKLVIEGKPQPADLQPQADWTRINDFGYMKLNPKSAQGDYLLQIIVTDLAASGKKAVSTQSVEFEVVD